MPFNRGKGLRQKAFILSHGSLSVFYSLFLLFSYPVVVEYCTIIGVLRILFPLYHLIFLKKKFKESIINKTMIY